MDFGLARLSGSEMTTTGMVMGTPHYMSPEQVRGQKADARSDVFALGCLFYELLTGRKPFDAESMHGVLYKIMQEEPPPVRELAPGTPEALVQVVEKALAKRPGRAVPERGRDAGRAAPGPRRGRVAARSARRLGAPAGRLPPGRPRAGPRSRAPGRPAIGRCPSASPGGSPGMLLVGLALASLRGGRAGRGCCARSLLGRAGAARPPAAAEGSLARRAIDSQVELARRRLEAGSYEDAVREAEQALKLDPQNAGGPGGPATRPAPP